MNSRERFLRTMEFRAPDRVPYFEEGIRDEVVAAWRRQGLAGREDLAPVSYTHLTLPTN